MTRLSLAIPLLILVLNAIVLHGQIAPEASPREPAATPFCGFDGANAALNRVDPVTAARARAIDQTVYHLLDRVSGEKLGGRMPSGAAVYSIPVVVHVIHNGGPEDLTDDQVREGIQNLNDAFANVGAYDPATGVSVEIRFCLARQDPRGKATTGIIHVQSPLTDMILEENDLQVKNLDRWDPTRYLNIWVVHSINSRSNGAGVSGFAYYPSSHGTPRDGILIEAELIDRGVNTIKILVHEVGHYLGLYHTFEGGCRNLDCLLEGDNVCDTPPDASSADVPCDVGVNTCTSDADDHSTNNPFRPVALGGKGDQSDMIENYMDYGSQVCKSAFTNGQRERMIAVLTSARGSLLGSRGCDDPCTADIIPAFSQGDTVILAGATLQLTNRTTGGATSYTWLLDGRPFATTTNTSLTFAKKGTFKVTLVASTSDSTCARSLSVTVAVKCPMSLSLTADRTSIQPGEAVTFTNASTGGESYEVYADGVFIGTLAEASGSNSMQYTFASPGGYQVYMVGIAGECRDTVGPILIRVGECKSEKEESLWYFGAGTGLDFRLGAPFVVPDGPMPTHEGGATICDSRGRLLFYSDGSTVWRADGKVMENGYGIIGSQWAVQGTTIVKSPVSESLYYLFTVLNWGDNENGLRYSVIDMSRNEGFGAVTDRKNVLLTELASERLAAVYHENCLDVWIVVHEEWSSRFLAYLLTPDGIAPNPVVSDLGESADGDNRYGMLKFSPDGRKLVSVLGGTRLRSTLELFDFDPGTGVVSNARKLNAKADMIGAYAAEFSPNNNRLYVTAVNGDWVNQYDLRQPSTPEIINSVVDVAPGTSRRIGLQLGPDGKIYVTRDMSPYLDVIEFPNNLGAACAYKTKGVDLAGRNGPMSLPGYVAGYSIKEVTIAGDSTGCARHAGTFTAGGGWCAHGTYVWSISGPATIRSINGPNLTLDFVDSGVVTLYLDNVNPCGSLRDTLRIAVSSMPVVDLGNDTTVCGSGIRLDAGPGFAAYRWQDGSTSRTFDVKAGGQYWVEAAGPGGCVERDTIDVGISSPSPHLDLGPDVDACTGEVVRLNAGGGFRSYRWQDGSDLPTFSAYLPGRYWVTVRSDCGDEVSDTIVISERRIRLVDLGPDIFDCLVNPVTLDGGANGPIYRWSTGETTRTIHVRTPGTYWVYVSNGPCESRDTVEVTSRVDHSYLVWLPDLASGPALPLDTVIEIPLRIQTLGGPGVPAGTPFRGSVRFNATLLLPMGGTPGGMIQSGERIIPFSGVAAGSDTLALLRFVTLLGDAASTDLMIDSLTLGDPCLKDIGVRSGTVAMAVCRANGDTRLVNVAGEPFAMAVPRPNPAGDRADVRYSLVESAPTRLRVVDIFGRVVRTVLDGPAVAGSYTAAIDTREFPSGLYFIVLESPTQRVARKLMVER